MISSPDAINFDGQLINKINTPISSQSTEKGVFSSELVSALKIDAKQKDKIEEEKKALSSPFNMLEKLKKSTSLKLEFTNQEILAAETILKTDKNDLVLLFQELKENLMSDIKKSLLTLEDIVQNPEYKVPDDIKKQFLGAISDIKTSFTEGFGVDFETYTPSNIKRNEDLITRLFEKKDSLPPSLIEKLEEWL